MTKISKYLEGNWDKLKGKAKKKWSKLTDDDMGSIEGSYDQLVGKLKEIYANKSSDIENEIHTFLTESGFSEETENFRESLYRHADEYLNEMKEKSSVVQKKTGEMVKKNPLTWLGVAAVCGFVFSRLLGMKN